MHESAAEAQLLGRFLDWPGTQEIELCRMRDDSRGTYDRVRDSREKLLADYFGIDLAEAERERREILQRVVEQ